LITIIEEDVMTRRRTLEKNILFLGMDQSCSGQMAEAIAKKLAPPDTRIFSAALVPRDVPPAAIEVMKEVEVEMPTERAKALDSVPMDHIDLVVALGATPRNGAWPALPPNARLVHWSIPDTRVANSDPPLRSMLRFVRDEIDRGVAALFLDHWRNLTH
jgi:protein-tyrosine-phosphatase